MRNEELGVRSEELMEGFALTQYNCKETSRCVLIGAK